MVQCQSKSMGWRSLSGYRVCPTNCCWFEGTNEQVLVWGTRFGEHQVKEFFFVRRYEHLYPYWLILNMCREISLRKWLRITSRLGQGIMNRLIKIWVVEIAHSFKRGLHPQHLHHLVVYPPRLNMIIKVGHQDLSLREVIHVTGFSQLIKVW